MTDKSTEKILADIGGYMSRMGEPGSDIYFLYVETQEGMQSLRLVQEFIDTIQDVNSFALGALLYDLWLEMTPKWGALRFELEAENFSAKFDYNVDPADGRTDERSLAAVKTRFPEKPIVYMTNDDYRKQRMRHRALFGD